MISSADSASFRIVVGAFRKPLLLEYSSEKAKTVIGKLVLFEIRVIILHFLWPVSGCERVCVMNYLFSEFTLTGMLSKSVETLEFEF